MEKRTLLAVVLSVIVISVGFMIQNMMYPPIEPDAVRPAPVPVDETSDAPAAPAPVRIGEILPVPDDEAVEREIRYHGTQTRPQMLDITFTTVGGAVTSIELPRHRDGDRPVEMLIRSSEDQSAFNVYFGGPDGTPTDVPFHYRTISEHVHEFHRDFYVAGAEDKPFTVIKRYTFHPDEYLFEISITLRNSVNEMLPLDPERAYTLQFGPQIGPRFTDLDGRNEFRRFHKYEGGRRRNVNVQSNRFVEETERVGWAAIAGKYFTAIAIPDTTLYRIRYSAVAPEGLSDAASLYLTRPGIRSSTNTDVFRFYIGPKITEALDPFNDGNNAFGIRNANLDAVVDSRPLLGWLENILKFILQLIYRAIPNYGIAIIILTIIVKMATIPLTNKSFQSTSRMQEISPKINALKEKHKDNPTKMNQEMAALYKKEGVNPLGGCLPMLLQFPFFIAMFGLFNNHFDLRGAEFIAGWINDLSAPESIWDFGGMTIPLLGWNDLRLLPIIFVGTQIISSRLMQNPGQTGGQMKMMQYAMPIVFFFILYNMPSGLLVYWIFSNVLQAGHQVYMNKIRQKKA